MNDFDFEELDEAVSKLATKTHDEHGNLIVPPDGGSAAKSDDGRLPSATPPDRAQVKSDNTPAFRSFAPAAQEQPPITTHESEPVRSAPIAPVARPAHHSDRLTDTRPRNRGSFMDIVPPASRKSAGRVGLSIQPLSKPEAVIPDGWKHTEPAPSSEPEQPKPKPSMPMHIEETVPEPPETPKSPEEEVKARGNDVAWPDPLDFHDDDKPSQPDLLVEAPEVQSPFLAEAKVEKRPLGAFSGFGARFDEKPAHEPAAQPVKDELAPEHDDTFKEPVAPAEPPAEPEKAPTADEAEQSPEPHEPSKPDMHSAAMMSIPKQYHTESKPTDKTTRPVFDTKEYHPPLLEAAVGKHRGGGMWSKLFIAFVVLVLLGVAGYFAYLYVTQR